MRGSVTLSRYGEEHPGQLLAGLLIAQIVVWYVYNTAIGQDGKEIVTAINVIISMLFNIVFGSVFAVVWLRSKGMAVPAPGLRRGLAGYELKAIRLAIRQSLIWTLALLLPLVVAFALAGVPRASFVGPLMLWLPVLLSALFFLGRAFLGDEEPEG